MERSEYKTSNDKVSTFLGSIPVTFDRVESETRQRSNVENVHNKIFLKNQIRGWKSPMTWKFWTKKSWPCGKIWMLETYQDWNKKWRIDFPPVDVQVTTTLFVLLTHPSSVLIRNTLSCSAWRDILAEKIRIRNITPCDGTGWTNIIVCG
jgi:hypothetical protein